MLSNQMQSNALLNHSHPRPKGDVIGLTALRPSRIMGSQGRTAGHFPTDSGPVSEIDPGGGFGPDRIPPGFHPGGSSPKCQSSNSPVESVEIVGLPLM
jgi:hypothetical protein